MVSLNRGNIVDRSSFSNKSTNAAAMHVNANKNNIPKNKSGRSTDRERERDDGLFERESDANLTNININSNNNTLKSTTSVLDGDRDNVGHKSVISRMKDIESKFEYRDLLAE